MSHCVYPFSGLIFRVPCIPLQTLSKLKAFQDKLRKTKVEVKRAGGGDVEDGPKSRYSEAYAGQVRISLRLCRMTNITTNMVVSVICVMFNFGGLICSNFR